MANLITTGEFKVYKGINSEEYDPIISFLIGSVSTFIEEYTGRNFTEYAYTDKVEYFNASEYPRYFPDAFPILSVAELAVSVDGGVTYTVLVEDTDFFVDLKEDSIINNTVYVGFTNSTIAHKSGRLTYKGGYITTPNDVKVATMDLVEHYRNKEYTPSMSLQGASVDNPVVFITGNLLPPHIRRILDLYRVL